jgi:hypothetical protein
VCGEFEAIFSRVQARDIPYGSEPYNRLRTVGRALHAWVIPEQASVPEAWRVFDASGSLTDHALEKRLKEVGRQVARFAYLHTSAQAQAFLRAWESTPVNPEGAQDEPLVLTT